MDQHPELAFFNGLSGTLRIALSEPPQRVAPRLQNLKATPAARITSLSFEVRLFENDHPRPLTDAEWSSVAFDAATIELRSERGKGTVHHTAPDSRRFTVRDLAAAVERTERETRASSEWFGGIDVHHVFFEGLAPEDDGAFSIMWGS